MKKVSHNIRKRLIKDTNIRLCKKDTYVNMKLKLCNYIYSNMSIQEIKNEIIYLDLYNFRVDKILSHIKSIIDVIMAALIGISSIIIACDKNLFDIITNELLWFTIFVVSILYILDFADDLKQKKCDTNQKYCKLKLECLNKVLNVKLEELNNPKQKTDYNHKHFKVKVSSIK